MARPMPRTRPSRAVTAVERRGLVKCGHHDGRLGPTGSGTPGTASGGSTVTGTITQCPTTGARVPTDRGHGAMLKRTVRRPGRRSADSARAPQLRVEVAGDPVRADGRQAGE